MPSWKNIGLSYSALLNSVKSCEGVNKQFVRYKKPRFIPQAASKVYRVKEPAKIDPEEYKLQTEWQNQYNTAMKSIRSYLVNYHSQIEKGRIVSAGPVIPFEELYGEMVEKNEKWNAETAKLKQHDVEEKAELARQRYEAMVEREQKERAEMLEEAKKKVLEYKEYQDDFIKEEELEDKIDELLNSRSDHNFALLLDGTTTNEEVNRHIGSETQEASAEEVSEVITEALEDVEKETTDPPTQKPPSE